MINKIKQWAKKIKLNIATLYLAYKHKDTPWYAKVLAIITVGYALSPIDLIPDFIPIVGFIDDALLLPGLIWLSLKLIPKSVIDSCKEDAKDIFKDGRPKNYYGAIAILFIWCSIFYFILKAVI